MYAGFGAFVSGARDLDATRMAGRYSATDSKSGMEATVLDALVRVLGGKCSGTKKEKCDEVVRLLGVRKIRPLLWCMRPYPTTSWCRTSS